MTRRSLRRMARTWVWGSVASFAVGAVIILIGAAFEDLRVVHFGGVFCLPGLVVYYAALGLLIVTPLARLSKTFLAWSTGNRGGLGKPKCSAWPVQTPPEGVWDREIDG